MDIAADASLDLSRGGELSIVTYFPDGYIYNPAGANYAFTNFNPVADVWFALTDTLMQGRVNPTVSTLSISPTGKKYLAYSWVNGSPPDFYVDGLFSGQGGTSITQTLAPNDASVIIGTTTGYGRQIPSTFGAVLATNRALTADEHYQVYEELQAMSWPTKTWSRNMGQVCIDPDATGLVAAYDMHPCDGVVKDLSGNGNDGTINGPVFENTEIGGSMKFDGVDDYIEIADDPSLDITDDLTVLLWLKTTNSTGSLVSKFTTSGNQRSWGMFISASKLQFVISSAGDVGEIEDSGVVINDDIAHMIACVYSKDTNSIKFYIDESFAIEKTYTTQTNGIFNSTAVLKIGDNVSLGGFVSGSMSTPQIFTRALNQSEIQALYNCGAQAVNFKTDYGVCESVAAESAPGELSNSPFRKESGTWKISTDTIGGDTCKVIECVTAGVLQVPTAYFFGDDTQAAYGTFEWWARKNGASADLTVGFVGNDKLSTSDAGFSGYSFKFNPAERLQLSSINSGAISPLFFTDIAYINLDTWYKVKITRSSEGEFYSYLNDILIDPTGGTGTNPATNTTHTTSKYIVLDLDAGDKIAYAAPNGDCSIVKYQGVV
jgi:hypothetical protein